MVVTARNAFAAYDMRKQKIAIVTAIPAETLAVLSTYIRLKLSAFRFRIGSFHELKIAVAEVGSHRRSKKKVSSFSTPGYAAETYTKTYHPLDSPHNCFRAVDYPGRTAAIM